MAVELRVAIASTCVLILLYTLGAMAFSRRDYGRFAFWSTPDRINYCGRRYYPAGPPVEGTPRSLLAEYGGSSSWHTVGHTFALRPIEATVISRPSSTSVCTMQLFVPATGGTYLEYTLSGGP